LQSTYKAVGKTAMTQYMLTHKPPNTQVIVQNLHNGVDEAIPFTFVPESDRVHFRFIIKVTLLN